MTEYLDAAHEAYRRLMWAQQNRPDPQVIADLERERAADQRRAKINRLRAKVA